MLSNFVTIFPYFKYFHFFKDPGQIAFRFQKKGIRCSILCFKNDDSVIRLSNFLNITLIPKNRLSTNLGFIWYLIKHSRQIDVLNLFHFEWSTLLLSFVYKFINEKGFVYLKMDNCYYSGDYLWEKLLHKSKTSNETLGLRFQSIKSMIKNKLTVKFIKYVDLWSVEDEASCDYYKSNNTFFHNKIITVLNGHTADIDNRIKLYSFQQKNNIILSVGRFGTYQKATDVLLKSFIQIGNTTNWNLHLAGSIDASFDAFREQYFKDHPELQNRIIFHGNIERFELLNLYNRSKIFCLPSRFETFAIAYSEAMYFKNAIVTTPKSSLKDIIKKFDFGELVEIDNSQYLTDILLTIINNPTLNEHYADNAKIFCDQFLSWDTITESLLKEIEYRTQLKQQ